MILGGQQRPFMNRRRGERIIFLIFPAALRSGSDEAKISLKVPQSAITSSPGTWNWPSPHLLNWQRSLPRGSAGVVNAVVVDPNDHRCCRLAATAALSWSARDLTFSSVSRHFGSASEVTCSPIALKESTVLQAWLLPTTM